MRYYEESMQKWYDAEIIDPLCHQNLSNPDEEWLKNPGCQPDIKAFHKEIGYTYPVRPDIWEGVDLSSDKFIKHL